NSSNTFDASDAFNASDTSDACNAFNASDTFNTSDTSNISTKQLTSPTSKLKIKRSRDTISYTLAPNTSLLLTKKVEDKQTYKYKDNI
ncbi:2453_t:CDS:2, partial [Gigaspora margarita]